MERELMYDVIVIGGGPAGSTAAYYLAKKEGLKILIADKVDFPRHKACGGALGRSKDWPYEFDNYTEIKDKLNAYGVNGIRFYCGSKLVYEADGSHFFDHAKRFEFDNLLLQAALSKKNVEFKKFKARKIESISTDGSAGYKVTGESGALTARFIIGAEGWGSITAKYIGNPPLKRDGYCMCYEYEIVCDKKDTHASFYYFWDNELGYAWLFPTVDGYYAAVGFVGKFKTPLKASLDKFVSFAVEKDLLPREHTIKERFSAPDPLSLVKYCCRDNVLLCGDSMGLVNQLSGEGIYYAMKSGKIAGQTITQSEKDVAKRYERAMRHTKREVMLTPWMPWMPPKEISSLIVKLLLSNVFKRHFLKKFFKYYHHPQNTRYSLINR